MTDVLEETETATEADADARRDALAERLFGAFILGSELLTIELGRRLGLYAALRDCSPVTATELAQRAGIAERYAREWLEQQAAAGIVDVADETGVATTRRFVLPAAHISVLLDPEHPANVVAFAPFLTGFALTLPAVTRAYRTGAGVAFERFGTELRHGIGLGNRPMFATSMPAWIDALPDIAERLRTGGAVLDAGCGLGYSSVALAKAFDRITVDGIDLDSASVVEARAIVRDQGLDGRVRFTLGNTSDPTDLPTSQCGYDLVTIFEALHDMGDPVSTLSAVRPLLTEGGAVLVADERVADEFTAPAGEVDRLMHAASVLHCLPATMAESQNTANGTVLRASTVRAWAAAAGFTVTELPIDNLLWRFYRLDPVS